MGGGWFLCAQEIPGRAAHPQPDLLPGAAAQPGELGGCMRTPGSPSRACWACLRTGYDFWRSAVTRLPHVQSMLCTASCCSGNSTAALLFTDCAEPRACTSCMAMHAIITGALLVERGHEVKRGVMTIPLCAGSCGRGPHDAATELLHQAEGRRQIRRVPARLWCHKPRRWRRTRCAPLRH